MRHAGNSAADAGAMHSNPLHACLAPRRKVQRENLPAQATAAQVPARVVVPMARRLDSSEQFGNRGRGRSQLGHEQSR